MPLLNTAAPLKSEEKIEAYLAAVRADGDPELLAAAEAEVELARGMFPKGIFRYRSHEEANAHAENVLIDAIEMLEQKRIQAKASDADANISPLCPAGQRRG